MHAPRTRWKVAEVPCDPGGAAALWADARRRGARGAVTSWGSGIAHRAMVRLYWEDAASGGMTPDERRIAEDMVEEDWAPHWRGTLAPFRVTSSLSLVPAWETPPEGVGTVLRIDPGMAFGAGDHPTTRLCARLLERFAGRGGLSGPVLDVGTGTGALALVAARLGAARVDALDIDPFCFASCRRNAALNGLEEAVRPLLLSLDLLPGRYPLLLANIVAGQLASLGGEFAAHLAPGGRMLLSGFRVDEESAVREILPPGTRVEECAEEEGWVALLTQGREAGRG